MKIKCTNLTLCLLSPRNLPNFALQNEKMRGGAAVARQVHSLKVAGSIPAPATTFLRLGGSEAAKQQANTWQTSRRFSKLTNNE